MKFVDRVVDSTSRVLLCQECEAPARFVLHSDNPRSDDLPVCGSACFLSVAQNSIDNGYSPLEDNVVLRPIYDTNADDYVQAFAVYPWRWGRPEGV